MNRRDLLRGLLALPLAPLAAKLLPKETSRYVGMDLGYSDSTSIWLVNWDSSKVFSAFPFKSLHDGPIEQWSAKDVQRLMASQWDRNWLKEQINGH